MNKKLLKISITLLLVVAMVLGVAAVGSAKDESKLVFSGVTMRMLNDADKPGDGSVQGFLEIKVRNIEARGVGFVLQYDPTVITLSDAATNEPVTKDLNFLEMKSLVKWDVTNDFKDGTFMLGWGEGAGVTHDVTNNRVTAGFNIAVDATKFMDESNAWVLSSDYPNIKLQEYKGGESNNEQTPVVDGQGKTLTLGAISFRINNPASFAKLTSEQLANVFRLKTDDKGAGVYMILYVDNTSNPPLVKYDDESHLAYEVAVDNALSLVTVDRDNAVTNAAEIFATGMEADLLNWMNANMSDVTAIYADGSKISSNVVWGKGTEGVDYKVTAASGKYDALGGTYTVWQKFNDDVKVQATVTVRPVKALSFKAENDYLHYLKPGDSVDPAKLIPAGDDAKKVLSLPGTVNVVFDTVVPNDKALKMAVSDEWRCDVAPTGADKSNLLAIRDGGDDGHGIEGQYEYSAVIAGSLDEDGNPVGTIFPAWVTDATGSDKRVTVVRVLGEVTDAPVWPDDFTAWVTDDGTLKINIKSVGGVSDLTGYDFTVRLPGGLVLDKGQFADAANNYKTELNDDGSVLISIKAEKPAAGDANEPVQDALRRAINLGDKLGEFGLAAKAPSKPQSDWTDFATDPRCNIYRGTGADETGDYSFDFSSMPQIISYVAGGTMPTTIALPMGETVGITYSGLTGDEPGKLTTITVDKWEADATPAVGGTVTLTGQLTDGCMYADHGTVNNPNKIKVSLKLKVVDGAELPEEKINELQDIIFAKMQVGYDKADSRTITIKNIGDCDINGLTVRMIPVNMTPDGSTDALAVEDVFTMTVSPPFKLGVDGTVTCTIERNLGLPVGSYKAKVIVGSNRTAVLGSFYVSVDIVENPVFPVEVIADPTVAGTAQGSGSYEIGETVNIKAEAFVDSDGYKDYEFVGWEVEAGFDISFDPSATAADASFTMPDLDKLMPTATEKQLTIKAKFREGDGAALRLTDLRLYNPDSTLNNLLAWDDTSKTYSKTTFAPLNRKYWAVVPSEAETNRVEFDFELPLGSALDLSAVDFVIKLNGTELAKGTDWSYDSAAGRGVIDALALKTVPDENVLTIEVKRTDKDVSRAYTVNIKRRLPLSSMGELEYGNSPFGLIMRAGGDTDAKKEAFRTSNSFTKENVPANGVAGVVYHPEAWGDSAVAAAKDTTEGANRDLNNYDRNDWALFVYQGKKLVVPGIGKVKNSLNEDVAAADVSMTIYGLVELTSTSDKLTEVFKEGTPFDLQLSADGKAEWPKNADGNSKRVRPGVYAVSYEFTDYDGTTARIERPLIVLYGIGDVDMNGKADKTDAAYIAKRYNALLPTGMDSSYQVYKYRICDANRDRNINVGDRNTIANGQLTEFYKQIGE